MKTISIGRVTDLGDLEYALRELADFADSAANEVAKLEKRIEELEGELEDARYRLENMES